MSSEHTGPARLDVDETFDAVVAGAGFAGLYALYRLRAEGKNVRVYEAGDNVGGTWYWNRYPGARCDAESLAYSYSFSTELEQEWEWTERYATQPEILRYLEHVAERFDLRRHIRFDTRVNTAHFDAAAGQWQVTTSAGDRVTAPVCIMATGCLSVPLVPDIPGVDTFAGARYQTSLWPHEGVDLSGQRVGIIGTGSSSIQAIPVIAREAANLTVFQRSPNFSVPAKNAPLDPEFVEQFKRYYRDHRHYHKTGLSSGFGDLAIVPEPLEPALESALSVDEEELARICDRFWDKGGAHFMVAVADAMQNPESNARLSAYVHNKIRQIVRDPAVADMLCPKSHPIGTKRICVDSDYFDTYNRDNVRLVDLMETPIEQVTPRGVQISGEHVDLDVLILSTGFDAMTGALNRIDIRGAGGVALKDKWSAGPRAYLGLVSAGFPNLFLVTGPGSPSVLSNMVVSIEQHVDFILDCLNHMSARNCALVDAEPDAEEAWVEHVNEVANQTLYPRAGSWYLGANVPGKPRVFMPYAAGVGEYRMICDQVVQDGYRGFRFSPAPA